MADRGRRGDSGCGGGCQSRRRRTTIGGCGGTRRDRRLRFMQIVSDALNQPAGSRPLSLALVAYTAIRTRRDGSPSSRYSVPAWRVIATALAAVMSSDTEPADVGPTRSSNKHCSCLPLTCFGATRHSETCQVPALHETFVRNNNDLNSG